MIYMHIHITKYNIHNIYVIYVMYIFVTLRRKSSQSFQAFSIGLRDDKNVVFVFLLAINEKPGTFRLL